MSRKIVIENCGCCPEYDHSGAFTRGGAFPLCSKTRAPESQQKKYKWYCRILPFKVVWSEVWGKEIRQYTGKIPGWCPLKEN